MTGVRDSETGTDDRRTSPHAEAVGAAAPPHSAVRRLLSRTLTRAWNDDVLSESASAAFWQTLSLPPLLLGIFGILGYVGGWFGPDTVIAVQQWIINITSGVFSRNAVEEIIVPTVADVLTTARGEVVSVGFVLSFWSGSSAMAAFVDAITRAHDQFPVRNFLWQRILSILLYLVGLAVGIVQHDQPSGGDLLTVDTDLSTEGVRVRRQPGRSGDLVENDLQTWPHRAQAGDRITEDLRNGALRPGPCVAHHLRA